MRSLRGARPSGARYHDDSAQRAYYTQYMAPYRIDANDARAVRLAQVAAGVTTLLHSGPYKGLPQSLPARLLLSDWGRRGDGGLGRGLDGMLETPGAAVASGAEFARSIDVSGVGAERGPREAESFYGFYAAARG